MDKNRISKNWRWTHAIYGLLLYFSLIAGCVASGSATNYRAELLKFEDVNRIGFICIQVAEYPEAFEFQGELGTLTTASTRQAPRRIQDDSEYQLQVPQGTQLEVSLAEQMLSFLKRKGYDAVDLRPSLEGGVVSKDRLRLLAQKQKADAVLMITFNAFTGGYIGQETKTHRIMIDINKVKTLESRIETTERPELVILGAFKMWHLHSNEVLWGSSISVYAGIGERQADQEDRPSAVREFVFGRYGLAREFEGDYYGRSVKFFRSVSTLKILVLALLFAASCATMGSRIAGPPYRYHTKVVWRKEADKPKPKDSTEFQGVDIRYGPIDAPHKVLGHILVRGWAKNALLPDLSEQEILAYLTQRCQAMGIEGVRGSLH